MRKPLASRIAGLTVLYCLIFYGLVFLQFSSKENFLITAGAMSIRGRYLQTTSLSAAQNLYAYTEEDEFIYPEITDNRREITGGVRIYYGGLKFSLDELRGRGLTLTGNDHYYSVNPEYIIQADNSVRFGLPSGTVLIFTSYNSARGPELFINAEFAENISEVIIPITPHRSSLIRDNGQQGIMYSGSRYLFSRPGQHLENRKIVLSRENPFISYRSRSRQGVFNPADYIIANAHDYENVLSAWRNASFAHWNQNAAFLQNEDDIIAYSTEALVQRNYTAAVASISRDFMNSSGQTYRSTPFIGGVTNARNSITSEENERLARITALARERSLNILREENILDYLFTRGNAALINDVISIIADTNSEMLTFDHIPGLLEVYHDLRRWRPAANNPIEHLTNQILLLTSENLIREADRDHVFVFSPEGMNLDFSLRLGKALVFWAERNQNTDWAAIGKSLVLSALESSGIGSGRLYNILGLTDNYPRAVWLSDNGHWAWTVSPSVRAATVDGNLNIAVTFSATMTHYVIINGIRPFIRLQLHGVDWQMSTQFERYDSSGWVYFPQEQLLIVKLRHRSAVENIRIIYRAEPPPPPREEEPDT